jgi:hypothetical protein
VADRPHIFGWKSSEFPLRLRIEFCLQATDQRLPAPANDKHAGGTLTSADS